MDQNKFNLHTILLYNMYSRVKSFHGMGQFDQLWTRGYLECKTRCAKVRTPMHEWKFPIFFIYLYFHGRGFLCFGFMATPMQVGWTSRNAFNPLVMAWCIYQLTPPYQFTQCNAHCFTLGPPPLETELLAV